MRTRKVTAEDAALYEEFDAGMQKHIARMSSEQIQECRKNIENSTTLINVYQSKKKSLFILLIISLVTSVLGLLINLGITITFVFISIIVFVRFIKASRKQYYHLLAKCLLEDVVRKYIQFNYE